jgi:hypothetical protein
MKIKILKDEYLFNEKGTHICDSNGVAIKASEDIECDVNERSEIVLELLRLDRENRGLDIEGRPILPEQIEPPVIEESPMSDPNLSGEEDNGI